MAHYTNKPLSEFVTKSQDWIVACVTLEHWDVELSSNNDKSRTSSAFPLCKIWFSINENSIYRSAKTWSELSLGSRSCDHLPSTWVWVDVYDKFLNTPTSTEFFSFPSIYGIWLIYCHLKLCTVFLSLGEVETCCITYPFLYWICIRTLSLT